MVIGVFASARSGFSGVPPVRTFIRPSSGKVFEMGSSSRKRASSRRLSTATLVTILDIE